jgi:hypothetical protein
VRLRRDPQRNLPETDRFDGQPAIGMGCFLELMANAATATGHGVDVALCPEGEAVHMPVRPGFGPATPPSPRWPLETRMVTA